MTRRVCLLALALGVGRMGAQVQAPDATTAGPFGAVVLTYSQAAAADVQVLPGCTPVAGYDCRVQLAGAVYVPVPAPTGRAPVVILLHGNHGTCGHNYNPRPPAGTGTDQPGLPGMPRIDNGIAFTGTGACGGANPIVVPSFRGYDYIGITLASWGYVVVSINANRGIGGLGGAPGVGDDYALIRARGVLVLETLQMLAGWNVNGGAAGTPQAILQGHLDFGNGGLMGHSRGGEGVRAALSLFNGITQTPNGVDAFGDPTFFGANPWPALLGGLNIRAIYEIAPTDAGFALFPPAPAPPVVSLFTPRGVVWNVLLPMCDGDVSTLSGVKPFDRSIMNLEATPIQKSSYTVWGTNHNFYNTQWMVADTPPGTPASFICRGPLNATLNLYPLSPGSTNVTAVGLSSVVALMRGNVGVGSLPAGTANVMFNQNFDPPFGIPARVAGRGIAFPTRVDRGYSPPGSFTTFDDFTNKGVNSVNPLVPDVEANIAATYGTVPDHDPVISQAARITWTAAGVGNFFQTSWTPIGAPGINIMGGGYQTLDFRVSRQDSTDNPAGAATNFSISLVGANGVLTREVPLSNYTDPNFAAANAALKSTLTGPVGSSVELHPILQTVRIPLTDFGNFAFIGPQLRGVRLTFDLTPKGAIYVTNMRLSTMIGGGAATYPAHSTTPAVVTAGGVTPAELTAEVPPAPVVNACKILSITQVGSARELGGAPGYQVLVQSQTGAFPISNSLLTMVIGLGTAPPFSNPLYVTLGEEPLVDGEEIFTLTVPQYLGLSGASHVILQYDEVPDPPVYWDCGLLH